MSQPRAGCSGRANGFWPKKAPSAEFLCSLFGMATSALLMPARQGSGGSAEYSSLVVDILIIVLSTVAGALIGAIIGWENRQINKKVKAAVVEHERPSSHSDKGMPAYWPWLLAALLWSGFIAGTSSTVIMAHDFFAWFGSHVFTNEASFRAFVVFWRHSWFAIVKGWHAAEFAILFLIVLVVVDRLTGTRRRRNVVLALTFALLFAGLDEYHQTFVPGRGGTWTDVAIDGLGASLAGLIAWRRRRL